VSMLLVRTVRQHTKTSCGYFKTSSVPCGEIFSKAAGRHVKTLTSHKLSGILGEERAQKFRAHACFVPDTVPITVVVRDTKGTYCIRLSFSYCESDSSRKASRNVDVAHTSVLGEQRLIR
jgi:hypothetical protein